MAARNLLLLAAGILILELAVPLSAARPLQDNLNTTDFIRSTCNAIHHSDLCYSTLVKEATAVGNTADLAALAISIARNLSRDASAYASSLSPSGKSSSRELDNCALLLTNAADSLQGSVAHLRKAQLVREGGGADFRKAVEIIFVAITGAQTEQDTCSDMLLESEEPPAGAGNVLWQVNEANKVATIALDLVDLFFKV